MVTESKMIMMYGPGDVRLDTVPLPPLKDDEVQCEAVKSLLSVGTEEIQFTRNQDKSMHRISLDLGRPHGTGYCMSARVIAVGRDVRDYKVGDEVYAICGHQQYFNIKPELLSHKPDWVSHDENGWLPMLRTGLFAAIYSGLKPFHSIVVAGLGPFGYSMLIMAKIFNASNIIVVEPSKFRADKAAAHGATHVLNAKIGDVTEEVIALNGGRLLDVAVDATAWAGNTRELQATVKRAGHVVVISDPPNTDSQILNYGYLHYRGQHLHGVYVDMMLDVEDPLTKQREFVNPFYPFSMTDIHNFIYEKFRSGEIRLDDLICGYASPADCKEVYQKLHQDRSEMLGITYDWSLL